ncbi:hypothetical protein KEM54_005437 [Ascosphaera aggregata]|nr:hypothetical protein KEM54_005437 [Ascosphaera aggregata]
MKQKEKMTDWGTEEGWRDSTFDEDAKEKQQGYSISPKLVNIGLGSGQDYRRLGKDDPAAAVTIPSRTLPRSMNKKSDRSLYQSPIPSTRTLQNLSSLLSQPNPSFQSSGWEDCSVNMDVYGYSPSVMQHAKEVTPVPPRGFKTDPKDTSHIPDPPPSYRHGIGMAKPLEASVKQHSRLRTADHIHQSSPYGVGGG